MRFSPPLVAGRLIVRRNRFVAEVRLDDGTVVDAHCPNTGAMHGCKAPGSRVWLSPAQNPERKLAWTWELVEPVEAPGVLVGLHTGRSNVLVREALEAGRIPELAGYPAIRAEVPYGGDNGRGGKRSRIDLLLEAPDGTRPPCYVEVKNVTAIADPGPASRGLGFFPDAVTERGTKHLRELIDVVACGQRAVLLFCVQRGDVAEVRPADHIDPVYGRTLREAIACGVEALAYAATITPNALCLERRLAVVCP